MNEEQKLTRAAELLASSRNTVVVTGAGISTEAGIPDFRGEKGIYRTLGEHKVTALLNINAFRKRPREFYEFYRRYFLLPEVKPSRAHLLLADLEKKGIIKAVVTQNIDNLHQMAGSKRVILVHGRADRFLCTGIGCRFESDAGYVRDYPDPVPKCPECGNVLRPDVVLFGEPIQNHRLARDTILAAQVLLVIGSSLTIYPLAGFVSEYCTGDRTMIIINKGPTALDYAATLKLDVESTAEVLEKIARNLP